MPSIPVHTVIQIWGTRVVFWWIWTLERERKGLRLRFGLAACGVGLELGLETTSTSKSFIQFHFLVTSLLY